MSALCHPSPGTSPSIPFAPLAARASRTPRWKLANRSRVPRPTDGAAAAGSRVRCARSRARGSPWAPASGSPASVSPAGGGRGRLGGLPALVGRRASSRRLRPVPVRLGRVRAWPTGACRPRRNQSDSTASKIGQPVPCASVGRRDDRPRRRIGPRVVAAAAEPRRAGHRDRVGGRAVTAGAVTDAGRRASGRGRLGRSGRLAAAGGGRRRQAG